MEEKICRNLKYSLEQMKMSGDKDCYMKIIDSIVIGPDLVRDAKIVLNIKGSVTLLLSPFKLFS